MPWVTGTGTSEPCKALKPAAVRRPLNLWDARAARSESAHAQSPRTWLPRTDNSESFRASVPFSASASPLCGWESKGIGGLVHSAPALGFTGSWVWPGTLLSSRVCTPPGRRGPFLAGENAPPRCCRVRLSRSFPPCRTPPYGPGGLVWSTVLPGRFAEMLWAPGPSESAILVLSWLPGSNGRGCFPWTLLGGFLFPLLILAK